MIGRRLGHYEIVEKLGEGGMGAVYRARDTTLGREVALKLLPEFLAGDREKIARLEREAHLLASLNHPNIATLHGLEESQGLKFLVMELVPGETLDDRISRGPLRLEECLGILRQIAEALEAAHEKGIIHRDLKPANVVVTSEGRVKVLDFGLAKAVAEETPRSDLSKSPTLTREGTEHGIILGTAPYMSPEQARGKTLDRRTDIWSFGCVFFEALTGRKAFTGETVSDSIAAILDKEPDWSAIPARTPGKIRDLLRRCFQKEPHRRLRDIGDARIEIDEAQAEPSAAPVIVAPRRYLPWAIAALVSAIAIVSLLRPRPDSERPVSRLTVTVPPEQALSWANDPSVAISPDGRRLVYVGGLGDVRKLYLRSLDKLVGVPIPGTEGAGTAFFSPDGESVGFFAERKLKKVRLDSGSPIAVADALDPWGASWGRGDIILLCPANSGLSRVSASGGLPSLVTTPNAAQGETLHLWPEILPDGKSAFFTILTASGSHRIALLSLDTGEYRVLLEGGSFARYVPTGHMVYVNEGVLLAAPFDLESLELTGEPVSVLEGVWTTTRFGTAHFAFSADGTLVYVPQAALERTLVSVDRSGTVRPITQERRPYIFPRLSPGGHRLAVTITGNDGSHVWLYDVARDVFARASLGSNNESWPIWTPDGNRLTFQRDGDIFWQPADGSGDAERLTTGGIQRVPVSWSPDGKTLVYTDAPPDGTFDIWLLALEGEPRSRPFLQTEFNEAGGRFSADGGFLAYASDETGRYEVFVRPFPGPGSKWQISSEGGVQPIWARSGREIFYRDGDKMLAVPIETEPAFRAGKPFLLFEGKFSGPEFPLSRYDIALDGQHFVMLQNTESGSTEIHIVQNWFEELKARVPR